MINIDENKYLIEMTRGDNAIISFTAKESDGNTYLPSTGDKLTFAVAKARNKTPLFQTQNEFGEFSTATPTQEEFESDPTNFFTLVDDEYIRCASTSVYSPSTTYYVSTFWDIEIIPSNTKNLKATTYVWDLQLESNGEIMTIIGETDTLNPKFKIWGEVAQ